MALNTPANRLRFLSTLLNMAEVAPDFTVRQLSILVEVSASSGVIARKLAQDVGLTPTSVTRTLDQWEDLGFVERGAVIGDRRMKAVFITPLGEEFVGSLMDSITRESPAELEIMKDD